MGQLCWIVGWVWLVMFWKTTAEKTEKMRTKHTLTGLEKFAYFSVFLPVNFFFFLRKHSSIVVDAVL